MEGQCGSNDPPDDWRYPGDIFTRFPLVRPGIFALDSYADGSAVDAPGFECERFGDSNGLVLYHSLIVRLLFHKYAGLACLLYVCLRCSAVGIGCSSHYRFMGLDKTPA